jgi:carboxyl-terminal processing protease
MRRQRIAWILSLLLLALAALPHGGLLANRDDDYRFVRTLVDIHRQVAAHYVEPVDQARLQQAAIDGMLGQLDPFTVYVPPARTKEFDRALEGSFEGVGIQINQRENGQIEVIAPIEGSPAFKAGIQPGDILSKVNGDSLEGLRIDAVVKKITGEAGTSVTLTMQRGGQSLDFTMKRQQVVVPTVKGFARKSDNTWDWFIARQPRVGYMRITQFTPSTFDAAKEALEGLLSQGMAGLILDLRYNPGGQLQQAVDLVDLLLAEGTIVVTRGRNRPEEVRKAQKDGTLPQFPLIVLVNEHSASASEIVAGSLMDNGRAMVVGSRSYGKGSVQEVVRLDGGSGELKLTVAYYYLPSGRLVHRRKDATDWGVEPQVVVNMDDQQQKAARQQHHELESLWRSGTAPTTRSTAVPPADTQLQKAVETMTAALIFNQARLTPPSTTPASAPATRRSDEE